MKLTTKNYWYAVFSLIGMTMGVGLLAVPYVIQAAGLLTTFIYFVVLGALTLFINLAYGELVVRTLTRHRLVGYVQKYMGVMSGRVVTVSNTLGVWASLMAYIIIGGRFFFLFFKQAGGNEIIYELIFFALLGLIVVRGLKKMAGAEFWLTVGKLGLITGFIIAYWPFINSLNYSLVESSKLFLPYGVILFAIGGAAAVPEMADILETNRQKLKSAIITGTLISIFGILLWGVTVAGITGAETSDDAITGLILHFGPWMAALGSIFEFFLVSTPFLVLGENLAEQFRYDLKIKHKWLTFLLALGMPMLFLLIIKPSLLKIIGVTGAIFGAIDLSFMLFSYFRAKRTTKAHPEMNLRFGRGLGVLALVVFTVGAVYQIYSMVVKR